jgi:predicted GIY-YIG superfamily endonuclease
MKNYYVYEIVNLVGSVEYVGSTGNPKQRWYMHKTKPVLGRKIGKFHKRQDVFMNLVSVHATRKEARLEEMRLQKFWGFETEDEKQRGSKNSNSKLTETQVKKVKKMLEEKIPQRIIAGKFNVSQRIITCINKKTMWTHITI